MIRAHMCSYFVGVVFVSFRRKKFNNRTNNVHRCCALHICIPKKRLSYKKSSMPNDNLLPKKEKKKKKKKKQSKRKKKKRHNRVESTTSNSSTKGNWLADDTDSPFVSIPVIPQADHSLLFSFLIKLYFFYSLTHTHTRNSSTRTPIPIATKDIKVISRVDSEYLGQRTGQVQKRNKLYASGDTARSVDSSTRSNAAAAEQLFQPQREYVRAVKAAKLHQIFAKPFIGALDEHQDAISALQIVPHRLGIALSASHDGTIKVWDLPNQRSLWTIEPENTHNGVISAIAHCSGSQDSFLSAGYDGVVNKWPLNIDAVGGGDSAQKPVQKYRSEDSVLDIDHHYSDPIFCTATASINVWNEDRSTPIHSYEWVGDSTDTINRVRFNNVQTDLIGACSKDKSFMIYDTRIGNAIGKTIMKNRPNSFAWNPYTPEQFTIASDDFQLYTFDMRNLNQTQHIFRDHVGPV